MINYFKHSIKYLLIDLNHADFSVTFVYSGSPIDNR